MHSAEGASTCSSRPGTAATPRPTCDSTDEQTASRSVSTVRPSTDGAVLGNVHVIQVQATQHLGSWMLQ